MSQEKTLPESIKIFDVVYKIKYVKDTTKVYPGSKEETYGYVDQDKSIINIFRKKSDTETWQILWHEIIHVLVSKLNIHEIEGLESKDEERIIDLLALGINMVLTENKIYRQNPTQDLVK